MGKKVQVLMSTYNGEKYLREQLDSILNQSYGNIEILVRDDGSTDKTLEILEEYAQKKKITYRKGKNCGAAKSFFHLLKQADPKADYFALSDQDDVWKTDKIERAVKYLEKLERKQEQNTQVPLMYCCALDVVDSHLDYLYTEGAGRKSKNFSFGNAMMENCCTGCTIVMNRILQNMIREKRIPECSMHDWWLYMTASCFGHVIYDPVPFIFYRQHEHNVIGMKKSRLERLWEKILHFSQARNVISRQLKEFYKIYHPQGTNGKLLKRFLYAKKHPSERIRLFRERKIYRQEKFNHLICKILILTGSM